MSSKSEYKVDETELEGLVFDCDGTLIDTMPAYWDSWTRVCRQYGLNFNEKRYYSLAGIPVRDIIQTLVDEAHEKDSSLQLNVDTILETKKKYGSQSVVDVGTPKIQCVVDIAKKYHGKIPLAVASSGHREHVLFSLKSNGILELFDAVVTAEDIKNPKPAPDIFLEAARRIKCNPKKCRGFEDGDVGMTALIAAGMEAIDVRDLKGYPSLVHREVSVLHGLEKKNEKKKSLFISFFHFLLSMVPFIVLLLLFGWYCYNLLAEAIREEFMSED